MAISRYENCTHRCHVIILINNSKHFRTPNRFNMRSFCIHQWLEVKESPITIIIATISVMTFKYKNIIQSIWVQNMYKNLVFLLSSYLVWLNGCHTEYNIPNTIYDIGFLKSINVLTTLYGAGSRTK